MNCSVKFFDPIVRSTPLLSGLSWIRLPLVSPVLASVAVSSLEPQAAKAMAAANTPSRANTPRSRVLVRISWFLPWLFPSRGPPADVTILCSCSGGRPLKHQTLRCQHMLDARQHELERERQQGDDDRTGDHSFRP